MATVVALVATGEAIAQNAPAIPFTPAVPSSGVVGAWPAQNANGPTGRAIQPSYPYPGQCLANPDNGKLFPLLAACPLTGSFACDVTYRHASQTAGGWMDCDGKAGPAGTQFTTLNPLLPNSVPPAGTVATPRFVWDVINPPEYTPDRTRYSNADYYEIGVHEAWGFQALASAGLFPNPPAGRPVPNGMQWTGLVCTAASCACPAGVTQAFRNTYCTLGGRIPQGAPLFTQVWGIGQINSGGGPVTSLLSVIPPPPAVPLFTPGPQSAWSSNSYIATWPSISIRATKGRPVVVKWVNEFPSNHVFCPHPEAADWPCAIDRTFMGVKARIDPALTNNAVPPDGVNEFGSPQQPDNSWVTHLHGGEVPPSTDGFAEKWFGSLVTAPRYAAVSSRYVNPPFENPSGIALKRPAGNFDVYAYPMVNDEATIWFHDHTLGKTHHNVIAGPAGFFPVKDPMKHGSLKVTPATCPFKTDGVTPYVGCTSEYTWLDPLSEPRNNLNQPLYDLFLAVQDRAFNEDGSINFSNGLGQVIPPGVLPVGYNPITNGVNPQVHPTWVPEYFGDHVLVNGVLWPKHKAAPGWYRLRIADGSDSRCWTIGFSTILPARDTKPTNNVPFFVIANDQGYLQAPVPAPANQFTMCPGERYELLVNLGALPGLAPGAVGTAVYMTNSAPAPFPAGITPYANGTPYADMNVVMKFDINNWPFTAADGTAGILPPVQTCPGTGANATTTTWNPQWTQAQMLAAIRGGAACIPFNPAKNAPLPYPARPAAPFTGQIVRQIYMNERADGVTLAPMGMQLNGVPFEYRVTETPKHGSQEIWQFINLTVDAHPLHPHLVRHLIVQRQSFNVAQYKALLCGSTTCQPGTAPGGEMQVVPDVTPLVTGGPVLVTNASVEGGWKDATQVPPGMVTTIWADWTAHWTGADAGTVANPVGAPNAPGTCLDAAGLPSDCVGVLDANSFVYEAVTAGPYVWHCHINSHEDSEMMRTSLVVPKLP